MPVFKFVGSIAVDARIEANSIEEAEYTLRWMLERSHTKTYVYGLGLPRNGELELTSDFTIDEGDWEEV